MTAGTNVRPYVSLAMLTLGAGLLAAAVAQGGGTESAIRKGGTFRIAVAEETGTVDPAVPSGDASVFSLLEATCAKLMTYPDKRPPAGYRLTPELASRYVVSPDGKRYTFTLRRGLRFSNGRRVQANAFQWAFTRILRVAPGGDASALLEEIVGVDRVQEGTAQNIGGIAARGNRLVIRLTRPVPTFPARMTAPWFCAVPPGLPADPEGATTFHAAGPYYVAEHVRGRRIVLRENRFYRGSRPHRVDAIVAEGGAGSFDDVLDRIQRGRADWGWAPPPFYLDPGRRLVARYGVNRSQFWIAPGLSLEYFLLNTRRPLFRNNPRLRRAVNFAVNRSAVRRVLGGPLVSRLTDQFLPPSLPGFRDARIYPLRRPNIRTARALARGQRRNGKAVLYTFDVPLAVAAAQVVKRNLAQIDLDIEVKAFPPQAYLGRLGNPNEPWDIARIGWVPDHLDPYTYLNLLFDGQFDGQTNLSHFNDRNYNRLLRRTARLRGPARYRAYGALDVRLAREAAPAVAVQYFNEPTLVSRRVDPRCIVLRPTLVLNAVCLKR
jgi:peptide/nickel transport system substrate-binding protein